MEIIIRMHMWGVERVLDAIEYQEVYGGLRFFLIIILGVMMLVLVLMLDVGMIAIVYLIIKAILISVLSDRTLKDPVVGFVTEKEYKEAEFKYDIAIKNFRTFPEKFYITVRYGDTNGIFNKKEIFEMYEVDEEIPLIFVRKLDKKGKVLEKRLELPE